MSSCRRIVLYGHAVLLRHVPTDKVSDKNMQFGINYYEAILL